MGSILFCVAHFLKLTTKTDITIQVAVSVSKCLASLRFRSFFCRQLKIIIWVHVTVVSGSLLKFYEQGAKFQLNGKKGWRPLIFADDSKNVKNMFTCHSC